MDRESHTSQLPETKELSDRQWVVIAVHRNDRGRDVEGRCKNDPGPTDAASCCKVATACGAATTQEIRVRRGKGRSR